MNPIVRVVLASCALVVSVTACDKIESKRIDRNSLYVLTANPAEVGVGPESSNGGTVEITNTGLSDAPISNIRLAGQNYQVFSFKSNELGKTLHPKESFAVEVFAGPSAGLTSEARLEVLVGSKVALSVPVFVKRP